MSDPYSECETGVVVRVEEGIAVVQTDPVSFCQSCSSRSRCMMAPDTKAAQRIIFADAPFHVEAGQKVHFDMNLSILKTSLFIYLLPALLLIIGIYSGYYFLPFFSDQELNALVGGGGALLLATVLISCAARSDRRRHSTHAVIREIIE